jgi:hypothetical protein
MSVTCFKYKQLLLPVCVLLLAVGYSCTGNNRPVQEWQMLPVPADTTVHYFDTDEKDSLPGAFNPMVNTWFSEMLLALKEPVLKDYRGSRAIYRFTWLRTRHHPVTVRVEEEGNRAMLFCKVTDGMGGYLPGKIINRYQLSASGGAGCWYTQ